MKKILALCVGLLAFGAARVHAIDLPSNVQVQSGVTGSGALMTVDPTSKAARHTEYNTDGGLARPDARASYTASTAAFTPAATPTDILTIAGSATKTIKVTRIRLSSTQTTAGINSFFIVKRSAADTSGTSLALTRIPMDSQSAAGTATALIWTANPTPGALVGNVWIGHVNAPAPATASVGEVGTTIDFVSIYGQPLVLRGTAEQLAVNFNGAALPTGLSINAVIEWTEE